MEAQIAVQRNDVGASHRIVRTLVRSKPRTYSTVLGEDGKKIVNREPIRARWMRHFASVFGASIVEGIDDAVPLLPGPSCHGDIRATHDEVHAQVKSLANCCGVGLDGIPAEAIKPGGHTYVSFLHELIIDMGHVCYVPADWRAADSRMHGKAKDPLLTVT